MASNSLVTAVALQGALDTLRASLDGLDLGGDGGHKSWTDGSMTPDNWDKIALLDVYLSQVCIKHEPASKSGAQMWFAGAGTYRKYTLTNGQISTEYIDLQNLISKKADPPTRFDSPFDVEKYNKAKLGDYYLGQVCVRDASDGKHFVGPGTYRKYTLSADGKEVISEYVDLNASKADKPKAWTAGPYTGIKAGDTVDGQTVVYVHGTDFYVWNGRGFTSCPVSASNISSYEGFFFARDWSEEQLKADPMLTLLQISVGDRVADRPVLRITNDGHGTIKTRVVCSDGIDGYVYYEFDANNYLVRITLKQNTSNFIPTSTMLSNQ